MDFSEYLNFRIANVKFIFNSGKTYWDADNFLKINRKLLSVMSWNFEFAYLKLQKFDFGQDIYMLKIYIKKLYEIS